MMGWSQAFSGGGIDESLHGRAGRTGKVHLDPVDEMMTTMILQENGKGLAA